MSEYRKRFVVFTMALIFFVLFIVFASLGIFMYKRDLSELEKTMSLIVAPWDAPGGIPSPIDDRPPLPPDGDEMPYKRGEIGEKERRQIASERIVTVFYNAETDEVYMLNSGFSLDKDQIEAAVRKLIALKDDYGTLKGDDLIYRRESIGGGSSYKIALADTAYIHSRTLKNVILLLGIFIGAMTLFYFISVRLSKIASKPMENALSMERQFVADLSHDLKTPVTVVLANNSILRSNMNAPVREQLQWIDSTDQAAKNMMALVNEMLTLSSLENSRSIVKTSVELSQTAEKCVLQMESVAYDKNVVLDSEIEDGIVTLAEQAQVERILGGLIDNALKYEPSGGRIAITLDRSRKKARFSVKNYGSYIQKEDIEHIFERFYRADKARSERGYGLGLPIIKRAAELIGAEIEVQSSETDGTVFTAVFDIAL